MSHKNKKLILLLSLLCANAQAASTLINGNFDGFSMSTAPYNTAYDSVTNTNGYNQDFGSAPLIRSYRDTVTGMGWRTTAPAQTADTLNFSSIAVELWASGAQSVPSTTGFGQFAELNAYVVAALYQDVQITESGLVDYTFSHRGRAGTDVLKVLITYLGADNAIGGGDDVVKVDTDFSDGNTAWGTYSVNDAFASQPGGFYRFSFGAVSAQGGASQGNFLDNVGFGVNVVPEPSAALLGACGALALLRRRRH